MSNMMAGEVTININVFGAFMKDRVMNNMNDVQPCVWRFNSEVIKVKQDMTKPVNIIVLMVIIHEDVT